MIFHYVASKLNMPDSLLWHFGVVAKGVEERWGVMCTERCDASELVHGMPGGVLRRPCAFRHPENLAEKQEQHCGARPFTV